MKILTAKLATQMAHRYLGKIKVVDIEEDDHAVPVKTILKNCVVSIPKGELKYMYDELYSCLEVARDTRTHAKSDADKVDADMRMETLKRILQRIR